MIEIQIKDKTLYDKWKNVSAYSSDLTHVLALHDDFLDELKADGVQISGLSVEPLKSLGNEITMFGDSMLIKQAPPEVYQFLGNRMIEDKYISVFSMDRVYALILTGVLVPDEKFKNFYSNMDENSKVSDLLYGNRSMKRKNYLKILGEKMDIPNDELLDTKIKDSSLTLEYMNSVAVSYKNVEVEITEGFQKNSSGKGFYVLAKSEMREYKFAFYNPPTPLEKLVMYKGAKVTIAFSKYKNYGKITIINSPEILPPGFKYQRSLFFKPRNRWIDANHYRALFYEYLYRSSLNAKNNINARQYNRGVLASNGIFFNEYEEKEE